MRNKTLLWIVVMIMLVSTASALEYFTYRMNFENGNSESHVQEITFNNSFTMNLPAGFSFVSSTASYNVSGSNYTWTANGTATINYTISSPSSCTEGSIYKSKLYENGTLIDEFVYVCIDDMKVVDYKVEYGHGCGNYIAQDEPYISEEATVLFNLLRVWNIGNYLDPDEDAVNATISCEYGDFPLRTYGRADVDYPIGGVNASFLWDIIYGGYWFRIGVISQEVDGLSVGDLYTVNCTELNYDFTHERVVASFPNYSLEVRTTTPLTRNTTTVGTKDVILITNTESYAIYGVYLNFLVEGFIETNYIAVMEPGDSVTFYADTGTNVTVDFIPSWQRHCFNNMYYDQILSNQTTASNVTSNDPPTTIDIPSQVWAENTSKNNAFDLDNYFSDPENDTLTYGYSGPVNITVTINTTTNVVSFSQPSNWTGIEYIQFWADDGNNTVYSNNVTLVVYPVNATTSNGTNTTITVIEYRGGGGKTRYVYVYISNETTITDGCNELWYCTEWSECYEEGFMNRSCEDLNECNALYQPDMEDRCEVELPPHNETPTNITYPKIETPIEICTNCKYIPWVALLLIFLVIILIVPSSKKGYAEIEREKQEKTKKETERQKRTPWRI